MVSILSCEFSLKAYSKVLTHAAKYQGSHVGGYLIGTEKGESIIINDILPICHGNPVGPIFDIAAVSVETSFSCKGESQTVVGYYFGNEMTESREVPYYITKVLSGLECKLIVQIQSDILVRERRGICLEASLSGKSILCKTVGPTEDTLEGVIDAALSHTATVAFIDLETHMDSAFGSSDFRNLDYSCAATS